MELDSMFQSLLLLFRDEEAAREAVDAAEDAYVQYVDTQSQKAELEAENLRLKISLLELQEREANAPIRAEVAAKAVAAWGRTTLRAPPPLCMICAARSCLCHHRSSCQMAAGRGAESLQSCPSKAEHSDTVCGVCV